MNTNLNKISQNLLDAFKDSNKKGTEPYDTSATVVRVDGETVWVHIDGGVDETPIKKTVDCKVGDTVQIRVSGGTAWITGNVTAPPTDDTKANSAEKKAITAEQLAKNAEKRADESYRIAGNTNQYFWHTQEGTDTGAHITEIPQEEFIEDPQNGGGNLLARSNGIAIRDGLDELATFGVNGTQIGQDESAHTLMTNRKLQLRFGDTNIANLYVDNDANGISWDNKWVSYTGDGDDIILTAHIHAIDKVEYSDGTQITNYSISEDGYTVTVPSRDTTKSIYIWYSTDSPIPHYLLGTYKSGDRLGYYSFHQGRKSSAEGMYASSMGYDNNAIGRSSHAQGELNTVRGVRGHAEGYNNTVSGTDAHAEGDTNIVSGANAHAEGYSNTASGYNSHAEGGGNVASGNGSHAEGADNIASGRDSHASGYKTIARGDTQTVIGHWNVAQGTPTGWNGTDHAFIIGNGSKAKRSNAMAVTWDGDLEMAGSVKDGYGHSLDDIGQWYSGYTTNYSLADSSQLTYVKELVTLPAGVWIFMLEVRFTAVNNTGTRGFQIYVNDEAIAPTYVSFAGANALQSQAVTLPISSNSPLTFKLYARQSSGQNMPISFYYRAMRVGNM